MDNVKYCGYCDHHFSRINKKLVKTIPAFRPVPNDDLSPVPRSARAQARSVAGATIMSDVIVFLFFSSNLCSPARTRVRWA